MICTYIYIYSNQDIDGLKNGWFNLIFKKLCLLIIFWKLKKVNCTWILTEMQWYKYPIKSTWELIYLKVWIGKKCHLWLFWWSHAKIGLLLRISNFFMESIYLCSIRLTLEYGSVKYDSCLIFYEKCLEHDHFLTSEELPLFVMELTAESALKYCLMSYIKIR